MYRSVLLFVVAAAILAASFGCSEAQIEPSTAVLRGEIVELGPQADEPPASTPTEPVAAIGGPAWGRIGMRRTPSATAS